MRKLEGHKADQRRDRRVYWALRAEARLTPLIIVMIIDGMGQAKCAYPRHPHVKSKDLEAMQRPRLHVNGCIVHGREVLVTVSRADFPKGTNVTCDIIANALACLRKLGVSLCAAKLHVQLDNTSSSNTNNILMAFMAWLVGSGVVAAAEADFLREGHTHEDIDQFVGRLASWIARHPFLETPEDFVQCIKRLLDTKLTTAPWPSDPAHRRVVYLTDVHDWKSWLAFVPGLKGHTGPAAPHVFRFQRRGQIAAVLARTGCVQPGFGCAKHDSDAVLLCRQWMADRCLSQVPFVHLPHAWLPVSPCAGPPLASARRGLTPKLARHLSSFCAKLAGRPYNITRGAAHIREWVAGTLPSEPPLDIQGLTGPPITGLPGGVAAPGLDPAVDVAFDPDVAEVGVADAGVPNDSDSRPPSLRATVVYGVAAELHTNCGLDWAAALAAGERAFAAGARPAAAGGKATRKKLLPPVAVDSPNPPDLRLEPLDLVPFN